MSATEPTEPVMPEIDPILVLCHTFFYDAFSPRMPIDLKNFMPWKSSRFNTNFKSSRFVTDFIIERSADLPIGVHAVFTSQKVFDKFARSFLGEDKFERCFLEEDPPVNDIELVNVLYSAIKVVEQENINQLSDDEGILSICGSIYNLNSAFAPILVSNKPSIEEIAQNFYKDKKGKSIPIPFRILTTEETERLIRDKYPTMSAIIDQEIKQSKYYSV